MRGTGLSKSLCGWVANIGIFTLYALALGAEKVLAFEAVEETFRLLWRNLRLNRAGAEVNRGVRYSGLRTVRLRTLDSLVKGRVDFIKADVEGCEEEVLRGAAAVIRKHKPVLCHWPPITGGRTGKTCRPPSCPSGTITG